MSAKYRFFNFLFLFLFLFQSLALAEKVRYVIDGDTFILQNNLRVRMVGIDAPEISNKRYQKKGDPFGDEAKEHLKGLIEKKHVTLKTCGPEEYDRFGRRLACVYLPDGTFVNQRMIETGMAEVYRRFPFEFKEKFSELEMEAKKARKGMWGKRPVKPENPFLKFFGLSD